MARAESSCGGGTRPGARRAGGTRPGACAGGGHVLGWDLTSPTISRNRLQPICSSTLFQNILEHPIYQNTLLPSVFFTREDMKIRQFVSEKQLFANKSSTVCSRWLILISSFRCS